MRGTFALLVLAPGRDRGGATHHRPLVVIHIDQREAGRLATLPARAEAILVELPRSLAFDTGGAAHRLARHPAVGGEHHPELDVRGRRRREGLAVEEAVL